MRYCGTSTQMAAFCSLQDTDSPFKMSASLKRAIGSLRAELEASPDFFPQPLLCVEHMFVGHP